MDFSNTISTEFINLNSSIKKIDLSFLSDKKNSKKKIKKYLIKKKKKFSIINISIIYSNNENIKTKNIFLDFNG